MNIEKNDKDKILDFIEEYKKISNRISVLESALAKFSREKDNLLNELEYIREKEISFMSELIDIYGENTINEHLKSLTDVSIF